MWAPVVKLAATVLGFFFERFRRRLEDTPENRRDQIHEAVAKGDESEVNRLLDDVRRLPPGILPPGRVRDAGERPGDSG